MVDLETIKSLANIIFDGLAILIVFALYVKSSKNRDKDIEDEKEERRKIDEMVYNTYNEMIEEIIQGVTRKHLTPEESKNIVRFEKKINDILNSILNKTNASRVCIVKYHNGNKDMLGKSFLKMSMTNEVVNIGVAPMMSDFKDVFRSLLAFWCNELEKSDTYIIKNAEEMKEKDITMYQYLATRKIDSKYGVALKDGKGNVIGFMCLEYLNENDFDIDNIEKVIQEELPKIQMLISIEEDGGYIDEL